MANIQNTGIGYQVILQWRQMDGMDDHAETTADAEIEAIYLTEAAAKMAGDAMLAHWPASYSSFRIRGPLAYRLQITWGDMVEVEQ